MIKFTRLVCFLVLVAWGPASTWAQCETWVGKPNEDDITDAHVTYRQYVKGKQPKDLTELDPESFNIAYNAWEKAFKAAPAADGTRPFHFIDGRKLLKAKILMTDDEAKKKELGQRVIAIYDQQIQCFPKEEAFLLGRKAYDMFYSPAYGYSVDTYKAFKKALEKGGNNTEYIVLDPLGQLMAYLFPNDKVTREEAQQVLEQAIDIADYNIENNDKYGEYYEAGKANMQRHLAEVEDDIFDCDYFKRKLLPKYEENKEDFEVVKYVLVKLRTSGCDTSEAEVVAIAEQYRKLATEINTELEAKRRAENPGYDASQLQKEHKYEEAIARYKEAILQEEDPEKLAQFYYSIAFIQTWQLGQYSSARENARKAAGYREGWGKPYVLIGDMYARTARNCGDDWNQRLAIIAAIEKWQYARSIDSNVAEEASSKIGQYAGSLPEKQDGFMRGIKAGSKQKVNCWISETVTVRFK
jgi:methionine salvage enolase-phosphatase E1